MKRKSGDSNLWNVVCANSENLLSNCFWSVKNGEDIRFWLDNWIPGMNSLVHYSMATIEESELQLSLIQYTKVSGDWDIQLFQHILSEEVCSKIMDQAPPIASSSRDVLAWKGNPDGWFTIKSVYEYISDVPNGLRNPLFDRIWCWQGPQRIRLLLWRIASYAILTNIQRKKRNLSNENLCTF